MSASPPLPDPRHLSGELDQILALLHLVRYRHGDSWLSGVEMSKVLRDDFGLGLHWKTIESTLEKNSQLVSRRKRNNRWEFHLLDAGERKLQGVMPKPTAEHAADAPAEEAPAPTKKERGKGKSAKSLPALFVGSSVEGLKYARALERQLQHHAEVTMWKDGVFGLGGGTLESLVNALPKFDFAVLVLTPDDLTQSREETEQSPRDNVIFELGRFMGRIGRFRTFIVYNQDDELKLPSDLAGVTAATFRNRTDGNYHAQMSPPATLIIDAIEEHGKFSAA